ncbi:PilN domain-containing protein [candidate division KSB1 bacterium]|nr:PilN domain-containing protein [candidate division KSB1 bacterium]
MSTKRQGVLIVGFCIAFAMVWTLNRQIRSRQQAIKNKTKECNELIDKAKEHQQQIEAQERSLEYLKVDLESYEVWQTQQVRWSLLLQEMMDEMPKTVWLEQIYGQCDPGNARFQKVNHISRNDLLDTSYDLVVKGKATNPDGVKQLVHELNQNRWMARTAIADLVEQNQVWQFQIRSTLK